MSVVLVSAVGRAAADLAIIPGDRGDDLLRIERDGKRVGKLRLLAWGKDWAWATPAIDGDQFRIERFGIAGKLTREKFGDNTLRFDFDVNVERDLKGIVGMVAEFDLQTKGTDEPELAGGGFDWSVDGPDVIVVRPSNSEAAAYFEQGNTARIRLPLIGSDVRAGQLRFGFTVTAANGRIGQTLAEKYGPADHDNWARNPIDPHATFIDLSFLNHKPAGKHGMVEARGEDLVFADGTPAKFFGTNVVAYSLFRPSKQRIDEHAKRLAGLGYNLVRLHHHDSARWVVPSLVAKGETSQNFDEAAIDTYFYWIKALRENGIYVWVDLHTGRTFREGDDIPGFDEVKAASITPADQFDEKGADVKGFQVINPRMRQLVIERGVELVTRENPYTGLAIKDDPAVMAVLLYNENDITHHFGNMFLSNQGRPVHNKLLEDCADAFA
ncbi:MAG: hypothetical protein AAGK78_11500, partial [Planctomycetota bacterium]